MIQECKKNTLNTNITYYACYYLLIIFFFIFSFISIYDVILNYKKYFFKIARNIPYFNDQIEKKIEGAAKTIEKSFLPKNNTELFDDTIPEHGMLPDNIIQTAKSLQQLDKYDWESGKVSGTVYTGQHQKLQVVTQIQTMFKSGNPLHTDVFCSIRVMEAEIIEMVGKLFNSNNPTYGILTSGGTESIILAVKAYRNYFRKKSYNYRPNIITSDTVHAAFDKACDLMDIQLIKVKPYSISRKIDADLLEKHINSSTILIVGSAPSYSHGIIDNLRSLSKLATKHQIGFHVDSCLGGFITPFIKEVEGKDLICDFRLPGVTSISVDVHKYGFAPKGSSVLLFREKELRRDAYFVYPDWTGGVYATPTVAGSRSGSNIAGCWATLLTLGKEGYLDATKRIRDTTQYLVNELRMIDGIFIYGQPEVNLFAIGSEKFNILSLSDLLGKKGWNFNLLQYPSSIHFCVTLRHVQEDVKEKIVEAVKECVSKILSNPELQSSEMVAMYGMSAKIGDKRIVEDIVIRYLDTMFKIYQK